MIILDSLWVFLTKEKSEVNVIFKNLYVMILNLFNTTIQFLHSNYAREYFNMSLGTFLKEKCIVHLCTCLDTSQQNEITERKNRCLLEVSKALMISSNTPSPPICFFFSFLKKLS